MITHRIRPALALPRIALVALFAAGCAAPNPPSSAGPPGSTAAAPSSAHDTDRPTSIIFLVADGAGVAHWTLAAFADPELAVHRMGTVGLVDTRGAGAGHEVSGSAPTATAYATGVRSFMGAVGVGPDSAAVESVVEFAMEAGMATGLVTTTYLADATPAAFGAHAVSRSQVGEISRQLGTKGITVLLGGGRDGFLPENQPDGDDLLARVRESYTFVEDIDQLRALDTDTVDTLLGLFAPEGMGIVAERGEGTLELMTETALRVLDRDPDGFFLLVENEETDTQSHGNADEATITTEMLDFDRAVGVALDYQARHPGTLVIATADHETGGMSLPTDASGSRAMVLDYSTGGHTAALVPLFAAGPGAERFGGLIRNDRVGQALLELVAGN